MAPSMCILFQYAFNIASMQVPSAFVAFTIHRFCAILYHAKAFFKTKRWVALCILGQWIAQFLISFPFVFQQYDDCTGNTFEMGVYTVVSATIVPSILNILFNMGIFIHVRKSSRRVQPQSLSGIVSRNQQQQTRVGSREISLLKQMIFTFTMFIVGWSPSLVINTLNTTIDVDGRILEGTLFLSAICFIALIINLFVYNHDVREYIFNKIRRCFHCV